MPTTMEPTLPARNISCGDDLRVSRFEDYVNEVRRIRNEASSDPIQMHFPWQTRIAISELLLLAMSQSRKNATEIRLLTSSFPWQIYGPPIADLIREFLIAGGRFRLLVWNDRLNKSQKLLETFQRSAKPDNFQVRYSMTTENGEQLSHMLIVGKIAYRLEAPHPSLDDVPITDIAPLVPARVCFNDKSGATELASFFDELWSLCQVEPVA